MSYTFSRRDFMKYTALTAVAIAGSGMLTGCSNPNRPVGNCFFLYKARLHGRFLLAFSVLL